MTRQYDLEDTSIKVSAEAMNKSGGGRKPLFMLGQLRDKNCIIKPFVMTKCQIMLCLGRRNNTTQYLLNSWTSQHFEFLVNFAAIHVDMYIKQDNIFHQIIIIHFP